MTRQEETLGTAATAPQGQVSTGNVDMSSLLAFIEPGKGFSPEEQREICLRALVSVISHHATEAQLYQMLAPLGDIVQAERKDGRFMPWPVSVEVPSFLKLA